MRFADHAVLLAELTLPRSSRLGPFGARRARVRALLQLHRRSCRAAPGQVDFVADSIDLPAGTVWSRSLGSRRD